MGDIHQSTCYAQEHNGKFPVDETFHGTKVIIFFEFIKTYEITLP